MKTIDEAVLVVQEGDCKGQYLKYVGGDWGPDHSVTEDVYEALRFYGLREALRYSKHYSTGWKLEPATVRVTISLEHISARS